MKLGEANNKIKKISLLEKDKEAFLELIDIKTEQDMKEVILEIKNLNTKLGSSIGALNSKLDSSIGALNGKLDSSIGTLKSENSNIKWVIGISSAAVGVLITIVGIIFTLKK